MTERHVETGSTITISKEEPERLRAIVAGAGPSDTSGTLCFSGQLAQVFYFKMKAEGWDPDEIRCGELVRITPSGKRKWREQRAAAAAAGFRRGSAPEAAKRNLQAAIVGTSVGSANLKME